MQALLELQRQADSTRISSTRELTRRPSSSQIPPLPPGGAPESSAALAAWDHQRSQSQSFTGGHISLDLPVRPTAALSTQAKRPLLMWPRLIASVCYGCFLMGQQLTMHRAAALTITLGGACTWHVPLMQGLALTLSKILSVQAANH